VQVANITNAVTVSMGGHTCATLDDGSLQCWGINAFGQVGPAGAQPNQTTPVAVPGLSSISAVMAGRQSTCAIRSDQGGNRKLFCFGVNNNQQLGISNGGMPLCGSGPVPLPCKAQPTEVQGLRVVSIGGGAEHTCAVLDDGTARCWGQNLFKQLGNGTGPGLIKEVPGATAPLAVAVGTNHNCILVVDGSVQCWGRNRFGQLGNNTTTETGTPTHVVGISNAVSVVAGGESSCALLADGTVKCWGDNGIGQLGVGNAAGPETCVNNTNGCSRTPVAVPGLTDIVSIASSTDAGHFCAVRNDASVVCWGGNVSGQLGRGGSNTAPGLSPAPVVGL
jgi:alpha-tubulin suppressor-like RCC1 family protein